ncbi:MAG: YceD family protein [Halorhodospira sp.]
MLPDRLAPDAFAASPRVYEGTLALADMPRLAPLLAAAEGDAWLQIAPGLDEHGRRHLEGRIEAAIPLTCQRCLEPYRYPVAEAFSVVVVASEAEGEGLPPELEPYVSAGTVRPREVAEEELLLALPAVTLHPAGACEPPAHDAEAQREALSPFAALRGRVRSSEGAD